MDTNVVETLIQIFLPILALTLSFFAMYLNANVVMTLYGETASKRQKALFAFIAGPVLSVFPIYLTYCIGLLDFEVNPSPLLYLLLRNINPLFALLYCFVGIKIMHLSPLRSLRLINISCLCMAVIKSFNLFLGAAFFDQSFFSYNIYKDFLQQFIVLASTVAFYFVASRLVNRWNSIKIADSPFSNPKGEIVLFFVRSFLVYFFSVVLPLIISDQVIAYLLVLVISILIVIVCIQGDLRRANKIELENKTAHINTLNGGMELFRSIKHDFYNILQTYGGYLELGELDALRNYHYKLLQMTIDAGSTLELSVRVNENPALFSLLMNKTAYAEKLNTYINISLPHELPDLCIEMIDLCRALGCLLDNAIEAAAESEIREVDFTVLEKTQSSVLIIISNNAKGEVDISEIQKSGVSGKEGHAGIGLTTVRKILSKYGNCGFHLNFYDNEFNAYIELKSTSN